MNDLIRRHDAINAHCMCSCGKERDEYCKCDDIQLWFDVIPTAQPDASENTCEIERKSNDMICRQDAIDAVCKDCEYYYNENVIQCLKDLPSAQPEIKPISYRDCANAMMKMWMDNVLTGGEYRRIMDKLNEKERERRTDEGFD